MAIDESKIYWVDVIECFNGTISIGSMTGDDGEVLPNLYETKEECQESIDDIQSDYVIQIKNGERDDDEYEGVAYPCRVSFSENRIYLLDENDQSVICNYDLMESAGL